MISTVDAPPMTITLKATARSRPGSAEAQTRAAMAASVTSTMMPAAATPARCHLLASAAEGEASTYGTGNSTSSITPICTSQPKRLAV